ncbi:hypothetical protein [Ilumatobacter sp.]|uniref:hypothetical protein n=1 Tax=Ilumatobacter sp. TaxID=1967498 RepID=UPI0037520227
MSQLAILAVRTPIKNWRVRDASALAYRTIVVAHVNAAVGDEDLNANLHTVYLSFGDVGTTAELINLVGSTHAGPGRSETHPV